ncbi:hypothetical protein [Pseudomonas sp. Hp2]|uniref:hypothetical protein n=1 Tax=Pseudomonas sp. Hp2 TaxID=701189 RepID=UPI00112B7F0E|nr:hypothetical protein [Pseudomonas sp. Hp2]
MLRIPHRSPTQMTMGRLAEYMREFSQLLGVENAPMFAGIKNASIGLCAKIPTVRRESAWKNVQKAKSVPGSAPARHLNAIESMIGADRFRDVELRDNTNKVIYLFQPKVQVEVVAMTIKQQGEVDGVVTGLVGADDTMHLYLRDALSRDLRLIVKDEAMARALLAHFRKGHLRLRVHGTWTRTEDGWVPEASKCVIDGFEVLDETPLTEVFSQLASIPGNGWCDIKDPDAEWRDLRGIN